MMQGDGGNTDSSRLGDLFNSNTNHLTAAHSTFLQRWDWLIDLEAKVMQVQFLESLHACLISISYLSCIIHE